MPLALQPREEASVRHTRVRAVCAFDSRFGAYAGAEGESKGGRQGI